jgi:thiol-disulfide isomerase/thioredoxin
MKASRLSAEPMRSPGWAILLVVGLVGVGYWTGCQKADPAPAASNAANKDSGATDERGIAAAGNTGALATRSGKSPALGDVLPADANSAEQVLDAMVRAYQKARTYSDRGILRFDETVGGEKRERPFDYAVVLERPNKLRMHAMRGVVVCDGLKYHAHFPELAEQLVERPAPPRIAIKHVLDDAIFNGAISEGAPTYFSTVPPQLVLLLANDPLKTLLHGSRKTSLLGPEKIGADECSRVQVDRPDGKAVFWIDRRQAILRRIEYPIEQLKKEAAEQKVDLHSVVGDFQDAQLDTPIDEKAFQIEVPAGIHTADCLMPPPLLLVGKPAPDFRFVGLDGKAVDRAAVQGKVAVLEFWNTDCDPWRETLALVEKVYQKHRDNPKVVFLAVSVDGKDVQDKDLLARLTQWQVTIPIARDPDQDAGRKFGISPIPAVTIIGPNGTVQDYCEGYGPSLGTDLSAKIEKLLAGEEITQEPLRRWEADRKKYTASLESWTSQDLYLIPGSDALETAEVKIAEPTRPKAFSLTSLWKCPGLKSPGNLLVVPQAVGPPKLAVIDELNTVVELSADGQKTASHTLDIKQQEVVTFFRTATDRGGKRYFLASGIAMPRVHLFDENWKRILSLPDVPDATSPQVADAQLADLDGDGTPEILVSYFGAGGVRAFSLDGKPLWHNQEMKEASRVTVANDAAGRRIVLSTTQRGPLLAIDAEGRTLGDFGPDQGLISIAAADLDGDQKPELCGVVLLPDSTTRVAISLGPKGDVKQTYALPAGRLPGGIEQIVPGRLTATGAGCWLLPAADGSIHVLGPDGQLVDRFNYGDFLTGLETLVLDGRPLLVVATGQGLEAWRVQWSEKPN